MESMRNSDRPETARQCVHMLVGLLALALRWLTYPLALAMAVALIAFNLFVLPRLPGNLRYLYRVEERDRRFSIGILMYPISVFLLILIFPTPVAAAMWGTLAFGDGLAGLVGSKFGKWRLPWNKKKSLEGLLAFAIGATLSSAILYFWALPNSVSSPPWWSMQEWLVLLHQADVTGVIIISACAGIVAAFLESLDIGIDDNLLAPLGGACVMVRLLPLFFG